VHLPLNPRNLLAFAHDLAASAVAWLAAFWLQFAPDFPPEYASLMWAALPWVVLVQGAVFLGFGLYRGIWRYASLPDLKRILMAVAVAALTAPVALLLLRLEPGLPRSVMLLDPMLLVLIMGGSRVAYRALKEHRLRGLLKPQGEPVLILGAGDAAASLLKELDRNGAWRPAGLLDDKPSKHGRLLHGVKILGPLDQVAQYAQALGVSRCIIAMPSAGHRERHRAAELCLAAGLTPLTVPAFDELMTGRVSISQVRKVEVEDPLGRDPVRLDNAGLDRLIAGRTVLITGAGGSIGAELARQTARFRPHRLVLLDVSEYALYNIEQQLTASYPDIDLVPLVGDVKDAAGMEATLGQYRPALLLHAAAYKHVPLMERRNAWEAVRNNALGTYVAATAAQRLGVERFVLVSTDKAVNPTNVMGASKRLAERICQALQGAANTRYLTVRFGNVLGSSGSVIPKFQAQIARGGPVTVTHPEIIRYFMSIPEAAQLVLQAALMGEGGEVFVLDMGEPVKILDLARDMIRLSGCTEAEVPIVFTGLRPGEKLYEELLADDETTLPTPHPKLRIARCNDVGDLPLPEVVQWLSAEHRPSDEEVRRWLRRWVAEYRSLAEGESKDALVAV
jgi:FlaA1/EpsC-like NDP-sugar epimerase